MIVGDFWLGRRNHRNNRGLTHWESPPRPTSARSFSSRTSQPSWPGSPLSATSGALEGTSGRCRPAAGPHSPAAGGGRSNPPQGSRPPSSPQCLPDLDDQVLAPFAPCIFLLRPCLRRALLSAACSGNPPGAQALVGHEHHAAAGRRHPRKGRPASTYFPGGRKPCCFSVAALNINFA